MDIYNKEYIPLIELNDLNIACYIVINTNKVLVSEKVFLQFFGVHEKIYDNENTHYFIHYHDDKCNLDIRVNKKEFKEFESFKSIEMHQMNEFKNHRILYNYMLEDFDDWADAIVDITTIDIEHQQVLKVYEDELICKLHDALNTLSDIQRRRVTLYYLDEYTFEEIAEKENCSSTAVQKSVKAAIKKLRLFYE